jgi:hypothetical protein
MMYSSKQKTDEDQEEPRNMDTNIEQKAKWWGRARIPKWSITKERKGEPP